MLKNDYLAVCSDSALTSVSAFRAGGAGADQLGGLGRLLRVEGPRSGAARRGFAPKLRSGAGVACDPQAHQADSCNFRRLVLGWIRTDLGRLKFSR